jgi:hypothetical protein
VCIRRTSGIGKRSEENPEDVDNSVLTRELERHELDKNECESKISGTLALGSLVQCDT